MPISNIVDSPSAESALLKTLNVSMLLKHQEVKKRESKGASDLLEKVHQIASSSAAKPSGGPVEEEKKEDQKEGQEHKNKGEQSANSEGKTSDLDLPFRFSMQLCVVGKPFSGTSTQCRRLAEKFNLKYISAAQLVTENEKVVPAGEVSVCLQKGESVSDDIVVGLVAGAIRSLQEEAAAQENRTYIFLMKLPTLLGGMNILITHLHDCSYPCRGKEGAELGTKDQFTDTKPF